MEELYKTLGDAKCQELFAKSRSNEKTLIWLLREAMKTNSDNTNSRGCRRKLQRGN